MRFGFAIVLSVYAGCDALTDPITTSSSTTAPQSSSVTSTTPAPNLPPTLTLTLVPEMPTIADTLSVVVDTVDPEDQQVTLSYLWRLVSSPEILGEEPILSDVFARGDEVEVEVEATDGLSTTTAQASVTIGNALPEGERAIVSPSMPTTADDLTCSGEGFQDADEDPEGWHYTWQVDGEFFSGAVLESSETHREASLWCEATPFDGLEEGETLRVEVLIDNTPPMVSVSIEPVEVTTSTADLSVVMELSDPDEDVLETVVVWWLDGEEVATGEHWSGTWLPLQEIEAHVTVSDGLSEVTVVASTTVVNRPPEVRSLSFFPHHPPRTGDEGVTLEVDSFDPEGSSVMWVTHWWVDGYYVGREAVLPVGIERGQTLRAEVEVSDGDLVSTASVEVVVGNAPPVPPEVIMNPPPRAGDAFDCMMLGEAWDAEGDRLTIDLELLRDGEVQEGTRVQWETSGAGEIWSCRVTVNDGIEEVSAIEEVEMQARGHNVLLLLADDLGTDKVAAYAEHPELPTTPRIDQLASEGVLFRNAWTNPVCSPTRATLLTGRYARRHGVGGVIEPFENTYMLPYEEELIPELLQEAHLPYATMWLGKWHLASFESADHYQHPTLSGFDQFTGSLSNLDADPDLSGPYDYNVWLKTQGLLTFEHDVYATTDSVNDALEAIETMAEPWFLGVSFNAPHLPLTPPPDDLHTVGPLFEGGDEVRIYDAMVEAMDTEIGRLLDTMDPGVASRTTVIFMGDNGTPSHAILPPREHLEDKGTLYEGGINVPLIITGPDVVDAGSEVSALVHATDVFSTTMHTAGVPRSAFTNQVDGQSLIPYLMTPDLPGMRDKLYSEWFVPFGSEGEVESEMLAVRDERYKLVVIWDEPHSLFLERFYDLQDSHVDGDNLLELGPLTTEQQGVYEEMLEDLFAYRDLE